MKKSKKALSAAITLSLVLGVYGVAGAEDVGLLSVETVASGDTEATSADGVTVNPSGKPVIKATWNQGVYTFSSTATTQGANYTVTGGTWNGVIGGYSYSENENETTDTVSSNTVTIKGGTIGGVYGGFSTGGAATGNTVNISDTASITNGVIGGYSTCGAATGNKVTIDGGTTSGVTTSITGIVIGGYSNRGTAGGYTDPTTGTVYDGNTVEISGNASITASMIIGGYTSSDGAASNNNVKISGGTITSSGDNVAVYGGFIQDGSASSSASKNNVTIEDGTIGGGTISGKIYGGYTKAGTVGGDTDEAGNTVTISGGTVSGYVYGGYSESGAVSNNMVTITGGKIATYESGEHTLGGRVYGGYSESGAVSSNKVTISGTASITSGVCGGYSYSDSGTSGAVSDNKVTISGGEISTSQYGGIYGGYSMSGGGDSGAVSSNTVTIEDGEISTGQYGGIYGGYSGSAATGNEVTIKGGEISTGDYGMIAGGFSVKDTASGNTLTISDGTVSGMMIAGGLADSDAASSNTLTITGGTVTGYMIAGGLADNAASGNTVTIDGGTTSGVTTSIIGAVYGGYSQSGAAGGNTDGAGNKVEISGNANITGNVYGGYSDSGAASSNEVTISGGEISTGYKGMIAGGYSYSDSGTSGDAKNNTVTISGGTIGNEDNAAYICGGYSYSVSGTTGAVENNTVNISGDASITGDIFGGYSYSDSGTSVDAKNNTLTIAGSNVTGTMIVGGYAEGEHNGTASGNILKIEGGSVSSLMIAGGYSEEDAASGNTLTIEDGTVTGYMMIAGGLADTAASGNTLTITGGSVTGYVFGGYGSTASGNTINLGGYKDKDSGEINTAEAWKATINGDVYINAKMDNYSPTSAGGGTLNVYSVGNEINKGSIEISDSTFNYNGYLHADKSESSDSASVNFYIPATAKSGDTMLTVEGTADLTGAIINTSTTNYNGETITLISAGSAGALTTTGATYKIDGVEVDLGKTKDVAASITGMTNVAMSVGYDTSVDNKLSFGATAYKLTGNSDITGTVTLSQALDAANKSMNIAAAGSLTLNKGVSNAGTITNNGALTLAAGDNAAEISGAGALTFGNGTDTVTITNSGAITQKTVTVAANAKVSNEALITASEGITINENGTLSTAVNNIDVGTKGIANNGSLTLTGDDLALENNISGNGTTTIDGTLTSAKSITNAVTINANKSLSNSGTISGAITNNGSLTTTANGITGGVTNNSALTLTEGALESDISGTGTTTVDGEVTFGTGKTVGNAVTISASKSLTNSGTISGNVTNNGTLTNTGTISGYVYGGANNSVLTVESGTVSGYVYGGYSESGAVSSNKVTISGTASITIGVCGGYSYSDSGTSGAVSDNTVTISGGTVRDVIGGYSYSDSGTSGAVSDNTVTIERGSVTGNMIIGGYSGSAATGNEVTIKGGEISTGDYGMIAGGFSVKDTASGNTLTISDGTVSGFMIAGGLANGTGAVSSNTVTISDTASIIATNGVVAGGFSNSGDAKNNKVTISGGEITAIMVVGGYINEASSAASSNTVTISGGTVNAYVMGGYSEEGAASGNTINFGATDGTGKATINGDVYINATSNGSPTSLGGGTLNVYSVGNNINTGSVSGTSLTGDLHADKVESSDSASVNFYIPANVVKDSKMLTVEGTADLTGAIINTSTTNYNGETITLISAGTELKTDSATYQIDNGTAGDAASVTKTIDITKAGITDNTLQATVGYDVATSAISFGAKSYQLSGDASVTGNVTLTTLTGAEAELNLNGKTINMQEAASATGADVKYSTLTVAKLTGTGSLSIDADLLNSTNDKIVVTGTGSDAKLNLSGILVRSDGLTEGDNSNAVTYVEGDNIFGITYNINGSIGSLESATTDYIYTFTKGADGKLNVAKEATVLKVADFVQGINKYADVSSLDINKDTAVTAALGTTSTATAATSRTKVLTLGIDAGISLSAENKVAGITVADGYTLNVNGQTSGTSVAKMTGFGTAFTNNFGGTLKVSDLTMTDNTTDIVNNGTATLTNVVVNTIENKGAMTLTAGNNVATITGAGGELTFGDGTNAVEITNSGAVTQKTMTVAANATVTNEASITASEGITINENGTLSTAVNNIDVGTKGIANNGSLTLTGDNLTLASNISGTGTTAIDGTITSAKSITNAVTINANKSLSNSGTISGAITNNGSLTTTANGITGGVTNNSALTLTGGELASDISGNGTTTVDGEVTFGTGKTVGNAVTISASKSLTNSGTVSGVVTNNGSLTTTANGVTGGVTNNSALTLTGGELASDIIGTGTTTIDGTVTSAKSIANAVTINASKSLTNSGTISGAVTNNGTLENKGSINNDVTNSGTLTNAAGNKITGDVVNNSDATLNAALADLATATGKTVTNDGTFNLTGDVSKAVTASSGKTGTLNINSDAALSASVQNQTITVAAGKILTANNSTDYLDATDNLTLESGSTLNMKSSATPATYNTLTVGTLTANDAKLSFDLNVKKDSGAEVVKTDKIVANTATGTLTLDSVNVTTDLGAEPAVGTPLSFTLVDINNDSGLTIKGTATATSSGYKYELKQDATDKGKLTATKAYTGTLAEIIQNKTVDSYALGKIATYSLVGDYATTEDLGTLTRVEANTPRTFTINGNNHTLSTTAAAKGGVTVNSGDTLNLKDITVGGFATAVTNNSGAIVNVDGVTFTGTTGAADITNNGTLNVNGSLTLDKGISGTGTTNFNVDFTNTKTIVNNVTVAASKTLTNNGNINGDVTNNGTLESHGTSSLGIVIGIGTLAVKEGTTTVTNGFAQNSANVDEGAKLILQGSSFTVNGNVANNGTLESQGTGSLGSVNGTGTLAVTKGTTTVDNDFTQKGLTVAEGAGFVQNGGSFVVNGDVVVNGADDKKGSVTLNNLGGEVVQDIADAKNKITGKLTNDGIFTLNKTYLMVNKFEGNQVVVGENSKFIVAGTLDLKGDVEVKEKSVVKAESYSGDKAEVKSGSALVIEKSATVEQVNLTENSTFSFGDESKVGTITGASKETSTTKVTAGALLSSTVTNVFDTTVIIGDTSIVSLEEAANNDAVFANLTHVDDQGAKIAKLTNSDVKISEGAIIGEAALTYDSNSKFTVHEKPNQHNLSVDDSLADSVSFGRMEMNDIRKRLGDVRINNAKNGLWARYESGKNEGSGLDQNFNKFQIGGDTAQSDTWRLGGTVSYTKGSSNYDMGATDTRTLSGAVYGVMTGKKGEYLDIIARVGVDKHDINAQRAKGDLNNVSFAVSAEVGKTYDFAKNYFVEPQLELTFTRTNGDDFNYDGRNYKMEDSNSLVSRLGFALGYKAPDNRGCIYTRLGWLHEYAGEKNLVVSNNILARTSTTAASSNWIEWAIGGQIKTSKATYFYADIEKTFNADINEKYRLNVGMRYSF